MTLKEFYKYLDNVPIETRIVYLRYKYSHEDCWTYSNEILEVDMSVDGFYIWLNDWNEGQEDIEVLGSIPVSDVKVPVFSERNKMAVKEFYDFCKNNNIDDFKIFVDQISLAGCFTGYKELTTKEIDINYDERAIYIK